MKVILFGATGMVGQGVLRECLLDPQVETVLAIGRHSTNLQDPKFKELTRADLADLSPVADQLRGFDACFFCLGVSSAGMSESEYRRITHDLTVAVARALTALDPGLTFTYVSGAGTDSTEHGRAMWARVKGQTENELLRMPFKAAYMFRPGIIRPMHGIQSRTRGYRVLYAILSPFVLLIAAISPNAITTTEKVGRAMIHVVQRGSSKSILSTRDINALAA
jgi:uncharacterized protein YbjT (DUF2867 family)